MKPIVSVNTNQAWAREVKDYLMIALGMILYGIGWTVFLLPNNLPSGAVPGIASIVYWGTGLPVQYTYFSINACLLLLSLKILGWKFSVKTVYAVFVLTFFLSVRQCEGYVTAAFYRPCAVEQPRGYRKLADSYLSG